MPCHSEIERIYDQNSQAMYAYLINMLRNEDDVYDVIQSVFEKITIHPKVLRMMRNERAYMLRMAHNMGVNLIKRRSTRDKAIEEYNKEKRPLVFDGEGNDNEFNELLSNALEELVYEQRLVVHLKIWEKMTFEEISELLEIPANTAASRYRYGITKLREMLNGRINECE
ncbi:MAG: sigma-70 family RNA polymerase sigma factor [Verrucomicrobia bacterium]|nr:sigma-70 family RNA polymerase sigma factor [Verrucomicrobiota bacterium]